MQRITQVFCAMLICLSWASCSNAADSDVRMPPYQRVQLPNGATLLLMERHDVPLIAFQAQLRGGVVAEAANQSGSASLLAQLLTKGAGKRNALQFAEAVAQVGGSFEAAAGTESIVVSGEFMARDQALMVELLSDVLQRPQLDQNQFNDLRDRQIESLRAVKDSDLGVLVPTYAAAALFGTHPYGRPLSGSEASLAQLQYGDVQQFYAQQIGADRLVLAVAGDFNSKQLLATLRKTFANWHKAPAVLPMLTPVKPLQGRRVVLIDAPSAVQTYFWIGNVGVSRTDAQRTPLQLVNTLFGGRFTSMLNTELRIKSGLTYGARTQQRRLTQSGSWNIYSFTQTATTVQALDLALQTYQQLRSTGVTDAMLRSGQNYLLGQYPTDYETAVQWADALAEIEFYHLPRGEVDDYASNVRAVTATQSRAVIDHSLPAPDNLLLVLIGNAAVLRDAVAKYGPVTELPLTATSFTIAQ
jgi:predicted Zn-dependent peptidase